MKFKRDHWGNWELQLGYVSLHYYALGKRELRFWRKPWGIGIALGKMDICFEK